MGVGADAVGGRAGGEAARMKVLVCGGRDFIDWHFLAQTLTSIHNNTRITLLIHGGASGADMLAGRWARINDVRANVYAADWRKYGRAAGPIRNIEMLKVGRPDCVVAFPGGRGTENMKDQARKAGVRVFEYESGVEPCAT